MSTQAGAAGPAPAGLVTLIVGDLGRAGAGARSRRPSQAGGARPQAGGLEAVTGAQPGPAQWSCQWSADGPGPVSTGLEGEPDLTLTLGTDDALSVKNTQLDPSVAFMQGRLKTSGDYALLLSVLKWSATPAFSSALSSWA
jgi:SCP-2 sterol transfer family